MSINEFVGIFIVVTLIGGTTYVIVTKQYKKLWLMSPVYLGAVLLLAVLLVNILGQENLEIIYQYVAFDDELDLSLVKTPERNYLIYTNSDEEVLYENRYEEQPFHSEKLHPIYLDDMEDYYIVIYSYDHTKTITNDRYTQNDYERNRKRDFLVLIRKDDGLVIYTEDYELIGREIDLNSFQSGNNIITFDIFIPYEKNISYIRCISIDDDVAYDSSYIYNDDIHNTPMITTFMGEIYHFHTLGDPSEILEFTLAGSFYYYEDSYGLSFAGKIRRDLYGAEFTRNLDLSLEEYAKDGYVRITESGIYYVSNDLDLVFNNGSNSVIIQADITLMEWETYIPD
ncbi:MAG: hypothetical protein JXB08_04450 [Bacilli bacterium]|nr:hypothetical protein [Bacilli bacterium]MBN2876356.1 hypothetical protein [Bacilli bacterium]